MVTPPSLHFYNGATCKNGDVLIEHGGQPHVLCLKVDLIFLGGQVEGIIVRHSYSLSIVVGTLLHS